MCDGGVSVVNLAEHCACSYAISLMCRVCVNACGGESNFGRPVFGAKFEAIVLGNASNANSAHLARPAVVNELERHLLGVLTCFSGERNGP